MPCLQATSAGWTRTTARLVRRTVAATAVPAAPLAPSSFFPAAIASWRSRTRPYTTPAAAGAAAPAPKIVEIVDKIAALTLLETAALVSELKTRLNIQDIALPAPIAAAPAAGAAAAPAAAAAAPAEEKPAERTEFKVKLEKFDAAAKAKVIREIKNLLPGSNLVEAKKFVESVPKVIKENVPKEEAEKMKATLEALGATVILE
ncbi:ribosomal protein L7/L12 C-terminal domain-containing protein [Zopfochytrium polystomum]|nr:ribosomal protein L7/L12 C-terminal domain-containing protein [Zopfochytrium polystomum]